jgi:hypothetical protein
MAVSPTRWLQPPKDSLETGDLYPAVAAALAERDGKRLNALLDSVAASQALGVVQYRAFRLAQPSLAAPKTTTCACSASSTQRRAAAVRDTMRSEPGSKN